MHYKCQQLKAEQRQYLFTQIFSCNVHKRSVNKMADHFDEKSGTVPSKTPWGNWAQTIDEVFIEVIVPKGTRGREIVCDISPKNIKFSLKGQEFFKVIGLLDQSSRL